MSDQSHAAGEPDADFDPHRIRSITSMRRSEDDRMVAGVCAGAAQYLRIDPVVVRVVVACLAFVGFSGVIMYIAAWVLIPDEGDDENVIDPHLPARTDREQVRKIGLFLAAALAAASMMGASFSFSFATIPLSLAAILLFFAFVVLPYKRRGNRETASGEALPEDASSADADPTSDTARRVTYTPAPEPGSAPPSAPPARPSERDRPRDPRRDGGTLFGLTLAVTALVVGAMGIYSATVDPIPWTYFPLAALIVIALGMLTGSYIGNGRPLALVGIPLAVVVLATTVLPTYTIGDATYVPATAADVDDDYEQGMGDFVLDLSKIDELDQLDGRTIEIDQGLGSMEVVVPQGLDLDIDARTDAGTLTVFGDAENGAPVTLHHLDPPDDEPDLRLDLAQTAGQIKVTRS